MERETLFADIIVPLAVPNKYTYRVPAELNEAAQRGKRAIVQFGKAKFYTGIIYQVHDKPPKDYEAKYLDSILDDAPIVTDLQLQLWDWIAYYYMCHPGDVMNAALPSGLKLSSTSTLLLNEAFSFEESDYSFFTEREHLLIDALHHTPTMAFEDVATLLGIKTVQPIINSLIRKKAVVVQEEVKDKYKPKLIAFVRIADTYLQNEDLLKETLDKLESKAQKQAEVMLYALHLSKSEQARNTGWIRKSELLKKLDSAPIAALVKKGILEEEDFEISRLFSSGQGSRRIKALSEIQQRALEAIKFQFNEKETVYLHGITGSGKTEIYAQLIRETIERGQQVLFLVPEIGLTTQLIHRIRGYFGDTVGVYHSRFSENERVEIWNSVLNEGGTQNYSVILGARSSLFLPFQRLGLIIIDEEHDQSYKQHDPAPRYHARDAAIYLASLHKAKVLLGSATPSLESFYNIRQQKYGFVELSQRYGDASLPTQEVCDIKDEQSKGRNNSIFSYKLTAAVQAALKNKEQVILFQNRRGFAPYTECNACNWIPHCVQCDVALIYHKQQQKLICHYCGYNINPPKACNACGSNDLRYKGFGTEKIEEEAEILFPGARVARMDLDTTRSKYAYKQLIDEFEAGSIDILIGTQMVTKGLDFDNVSVVGLLNIDSVLNFPDFRSFEKGYQLITQVSGRAGRKKLAGHVYIQTTQPQHKVIQRILEQDLPQFYHELLEERRQYSYPPFFRMIEFNVISKDINLVNTVSHELAERLKALFGKMVLGPEFPLISKIKNQYHKRIVLKLERDFSIKKVREALKSELDQVYADNKSGGFRVNIDVDPY